MMLFHSSSESRCGGLRTVMPALLTRMSMRPSSRLTRSTMAATAALSVTSVMTEIAFTPCCRSSATASFDFASLRATIAIAAPASANPRAMPRPIPPLPPVTIATLPVRSNSFAVMSISLFLLGGQGSSPGPPSSSSISGLDSGAAPPSALALPDQDQAKPRECCAVAGPLDLADHEARLRPLDHAGALADPEHANGERNKADGQKQLAHGPILIRVGCAATASVRQPHLGSAE